MAGTQRPGFAADTKLAGTDEEKGCPLTQAPSALCTASGHQVLRNHGGSSSSSTTTRAMSTSCKEWLNEHGMGVGMGMGGCSHGNRPVATWNVFYFLLHCIQRGPRARAEGRLMSMWRVGHAPAQSGLARVRKARRPRERRPPCKIPNQGLAPVLVVRGRRNWDLGLRLGTRRGGGKAPLFCTQAAAGHG